MDADWLVVLQVEQVERLLERELELKQVERLPGLERELGLEQGGGLELEQVRLDAVEIFESQLSWLRLLFGRLLCAVRALQWPPYFLRQGSAYSPLSDPLALLPPNDRAAHSQS